MGRTLDEDAVLKEIGRWIGYLDEDMIERIKIGIKKLPEAQQWVSCSERLPEGKRKEYWVCTDTGYQCECRWTNVNHLWTDLTTDWHWHIMDIPRYTEVVAWMPLPEPWKGEQE